MFKEIVDDARRTLGKSQKLTMSTLCSGELKNIYKLILERIKCKGSKCGDRFVVRTLTFLVNCLNPLKSGNQSII